MNLIVAGSTGLVGSAFLRAALSSDKVERVWSFTRRDLPQNAEKLVKVVTSNIDAWEEQLPNGASALFSGIATTRSDAGSLEKQRLIDHDLQVRLAAAAKKRGCKCFVLISSSGASPSSRFGYLKMKGDTEKAIADLGFDKTIILRPGPLLGERTGHHNGHGQLLIKVLMPWLHRSFLQSLVMYPVKSDEIAAFTLKAINELPNGVHYIESKQILEGTTQA